MFYGVYPLDKIPFLPVPGAIVVNTQTSNLGGEHWLAVYNKPDAVYAFDPLGYYYTTILVSKLQAMSKKIVYNRIQYQELFTTTCGQHCLLWLKQQSL